MVVFGQKWSFLSHLASEGYVKPSNYPLNIFGVLFRLIGIHFDHCKRKIQIFNFLAFQFRLYRVPEVTVGSEDPLQHLCKRHIC